jgi:hypothetical protein
MKFVGEKIATLLDKLLLENYDNSPFKKFNYSGEIWRNTWNFPSFSSKVGMP